MAEPGPNGPGGTNEPAAVCPGGCGGASSGGMYASNSERPPSGCACCCGCCCCCGSAFAAAGCSPKNGVSEERTRCASLDAPGRRTGSAEVVSSGSCEM